MFWGLSERSPRGCVSLIQSFLANEMRVYDTGMVIDRAHRLGPVNRMYVRSGADPKRPLIVKFRDYLNISWLMHTGSETQTSG